MRLTAVRTRRRFLESSTLTWNGSKLSGDIWPGIEKDFEELKLRAENRSKVETSIRLNLGRELSSAARTNAVGLSESSQCFICALNQDIDAARQGERFI